MSERGRSSTRPTSMVTGDLVNISPDTYRPRSPSRSRSRRTSSTGSRHSRSLPSRRRLNRSPSPRHSPRRHICQSRCRFHSCSRSRSPMPRSRPQSSDLDQDRRPSRSPRPRAHRPSPPIPSYTLSAPLIEDDLAEDDPSREDRTGSLRHYPRRHIRSPSCSRSRSRSPYRQDTSRSRSRFSDRDRDRGPSRSPRPSPPIPSYTLPAPLAEDDPPPPYPAPRTRRRGHPRLASDSSGEPLAHSEMTPLLAGSMRRPARRVRDRRFSDSSAAPSTVYGVARSVYSMFSTDAESDDGAPVLAAPPGHVRGGSETASVHAGASFGRRVRRYFRPLVRRVYWKALLHLLVLNFPWALLTWVYLFVGTLTGTTLLMALPLGAVLCFFDLLGARAFARGELALQTAFHALPHALPPPPPIFTRVHVPTPGELEAARAGGGFYRNTWAMFTDPASYRALFYFLVIKPAITLVLTVLLLVLVPVCAVLVVPLPALMRAVKRVGVWQAGVAVEGLCTTVL